MNATGEDYLGLYGHATIKSSSEDVGTKINWAFQLLFVNISFF